MPIHADVAARFHYLDGLTSMREAYADPMLIQQINLPAEVEPVRRCLDLIAETVARGGL